MGKSGSSPSQSDGANQSPRSLGKGAGKRPLTAGSGEAALPGIKKKSLFYAWEFGANLGHIGTFLPVARSLRERGHDLCWVVAQPSQAAKLLLADGFAWLQAPLAQEVKADGPPLNYAEIILRYGYSETDDLLGLVVAWRELMLLSGAELILADHAPTAILAARTLGIPVMLFGGGFFAPPQVQPTPNMRPWQQVSTERLTRADITALTSINFVLAHFSQPPLQYLAELFCVAEDALLTFPELDHYAERGPHKYWGTLPAAVATPPQWPGTHTSRLFAYLRPEGAHFATALAALRRLEAAVLVFSPGVTPALRSKHGAANLMFSDSPVDLNDAARDAVAAITYGSPAATIAFLLAGKPVLMIPGHLEQFLFARRVVEMGAGLIQIPEQPADGLSEMLSRLLTDEEMRQNATAFARKYANFDQNAVITNIVTRIEQLVEMHTTSGIPA